VTLILLEVLLKPGDPYCGTPVLTRGGYNFPKQKTNDNTQHAKYDEPTKQKSCQKQTDKIPPNETN
jgi:hypothetical protein